MFSVRLLFTVAFLTCGCTVRQDRTLVDLTLDLAVALRDHQNSAAAFVKNEWEDDMVALDKDLTELEERRRTLMRELLRIETYCSNFREGQGRDDVLESTRKLRHSAGEFSVISTIVGSKWSMGLEVDEEEIRKASRVFDGLTGGGIDVVERLSSMATSP